MTEKEREKETNLASGPQWSLFGQVSCLYKQASLSPWASGGEPGTPEMGAGFLETMSDNARGKTSNQPLPQTQASQHFCEVGKSR